MYFSAEPTESRTYLELIYRHKSHMVANSAMAGDGFSCVFELLSH